MSTPASIKNALSTILSKANEKTGLGDSTISDAVDSLIAGYGAAGGAVGLNARIFNITVPEDVTSGIYNIFDTNEWLVSIQNDPNAFIMVRCLAPSASTAMLSFWFTCNSVICYTETVARKSIALRHSASSGHVLFGGGGLTDEDQYAGLLNFKDSGRVFVYCSESYPLLAGEYQIVVGTFNLL